MVKVKLTKNELKGQKDALKRFIRYLPMLQLKKQQLQMEIRKVHHSIEQASGDMDNLRKQISLWVDVFAEEINLNDFFKIGQIKTKTGNIAGVEIPLFSGVEFDEQPYDLLLTPFWVDKALDVSKEAIILKSQLSVYHEQLAILKEELRIITQRVNLFEKIKVPEAKENIRVIRIYLGDLQTAEVVRGKIAKAKIEKRREFFLDPEAKGPQDQEKFRDNFS